MKKDEGAEGSQKAIKLKTGEKKSDLGTKLIGLIGHDLTNKVSRIKKELEKVDDKLKGLENA